MKCLTALGSIVALSLTATLKAEEGGAGQYLPGAFSSSVDMSPNLPGFPFPSGLQSIGSLSGVKVDGTLERSLGSYFGHALTAAMLPTAK